MARSPQEIFQSHLDALVKGDVEAIVADYADDAEFVTLDGPVVGRDGIGQWFTGALAALPGAQFSATGVVFTDDALLLRWDATSAGGQVRGAVDTFVFADGLIRLQTSVLSITS